MRMRVRRTVRALATLALVLLAAPAAAQAPPTAESIRTLAAAHLAVTQALDSTNIQLAQARNKTPSAQDMLRERFQEQVAAILKTHGLTDSAYRHLRLQVSTNGAARQLFDRSLAELTGAPLPGGAASATEVAIPGGPVGAHIGHVVNRYPDTPGNQGLLPVALVEASIAAQHAELALKSPANLDGLKLHAGHVLHALDPSIVATGPGKGYGVKKAATGIATHIELAARTKDASPNVVSHSARVAEAARSVVARADAMIGLASRIRDATSAAAAADLMQQVLSLAGQLSAGVDADTDGRIGWGGGEGGLQQVQEQVTSLLKGEKIPGDDQVDR